MKNLLLYLFISSLSFNSFAQPTNDEPCNATPITSNTSCTNLNTTNVGATATTGVTAPGCAGSTFNDVWYSVIVPSSGAFYVTLSAGTMTDSGMAFYSGSCNSLALISCNDDGAIGLMSQLGVNNLTPGSTIYIRVWGYSGGTGTLSICAQTIQNVPCGSNPNATDGCGQAPPICNFQGYCGNTSSAYTPTTWTQAVNAFSCGSLQNDSYIQFVADSTSISFYATVTSSANGDGIQFMVFSAANCGSGAVTSFVCEGQVPPVIPFLVTATGLTPGNIYYILIDGVSGDVCNYTISLPNNSGVSMPASITPDNSTICIGQSINLTASGSNSTYDWTTSPNASDLNVTNNANVTATPTSLGVKEYVVLTVGGNATCPNSNTDTAFVTVISTALSSNGVTDTICMNQSSTVQGATSNSNNISWTIQAGAGTLTGETTLTPTYYSVASDAGNTVILDLTVSGCGGTTSISHDTIRVLKPLIYNLQGALTYCPSAGGVNLNIPDSIHLDSAHWNLGPTIVSSNFSANLTAGNYDITIWSKGSACSKDTSIIVSMINSQVQIIYNGGVDCNDSSVVLNQNIGGPVGQWTCLNNSGVTFTPSNNITTSIHVPQYGDYQFVFTEPVCNEDDTVTIKFRPDQYVDLFTELNICSGFEQEIQSFPFADYAPYITNYIWTKQGDATVISNSNSINVTEGGYYICTVTGECASYSDSTLITVKQCDIQLPNTFTPNGDGDNDFFKLLGDNYDFFKTFKISIVNRWGNVIAEYSNADFKWNGQDKNGNLVETGVYFYSLQSTTIEDIELNRQGFVQVFTNK